MVFKFDKEDPFTSKSDENDLGEAPKAPVFRKIARAESSSTLLRTIIIRRCITLTLR